MSTKAIVLALCLVSSAAFQQPARFAAVSTRGAEPEKDAEAMDLDLEQMFEIFEDADETIAAPSGSTTMSLALPFAARPVGLDSYKMTGDRGFDPLGFAKNKDDLMKYRSAEIKHCRLAMLAAAGWPISELVDGGLAKTLNLPTELTSDGLAPSLLNGGLGAVSPVYWLAILGAAAFVEVTGLSLKKDAPGDFGFDPLGLYPTDAAEKALRQESELRHGRTAMIAITGFAFQEFVLKAPVTKETPFFFEPFWVLLKDSGFGDLSRGFINY